MEKGIKLVHPEVRMIGCRNCIWKLHDECPHGLIDEEEKEEGICQEMIDFFMNLGEEGDSINEIIEKFHIYKARIQEAIDYKDFIKLDMKIKGIESGEIKNKRSEDIIDLRMDRTASKLWWFKLNTHIVQSLNKISERKIKKDSKKELPGIYMRELEFKEDGIHEDT